MPPVTGSEQCSPKFCQTGQNTLLLLLIVLCAQARKITPSWKGGFVADLWYQQVPQIYIYSRHFTLVTDHRLLTAILGPKTGVPSLAAARLQSWTLALSTYSYTIEFWSTKAHANTDGLSRLLLPLSPVEGSEQPSVESVFVVSQMLALPMLVAQLRRATQNDPLLSRVYRCVQWGWPDRIPESLKPFYNRKTELTLEGGCVLWGIQVVVPQKCHQVVLDMLHEGHPGIVRMKSVA